MSKKFIEVLNRSKASTEYNFKFDTLLIDKATYLGLNTISNKLIQEGLHPRKLTDQNTVQEVPENELNSLKALVKYDIKRKTS